MNLSRKKTDKKKIHLKEEGVWSSYVYHRFLQIK